MFDAAVAFVCVPILTSFKKQIFYKESKNFPLISKIPFVNASNCCHSITMLTFIFVCKLLIPSLRSSISANSLSTHWQWWVQVNLLGGTVVDCGAEVWSIPYSICLESSNNSIKPFAAWKQSNHVNHSKNLPAFTKSNALFMNSCREIRSIDSDFFLVVWTPFTHGMVDISLIKVSKWYWI